MVAVAIRMLKFQIQATSVRLMAFSFISSDGCISAELIIIIHSRLLHVCVSVC